MADTVDFSRMTEYEEDAKILEGKINTLVKYIQGANYVVFFTGAGVSTSSGVPDYRSPTGVWTMRAKGMKAKSQVPMTDAQPTPSHMAQATLLRKGLAHYVITTNLDGIYRKAGLQAHKQVCFLHGCIYAERCTGCGYEFERNWHVRYEDIDVHDHRVGKCERCGSQPLKEADGRTFKNVGTRDKNCGTKDTHINFGERLDPIDWNEADYHCKKADLVIVAGTSMSLRHITHFPFFAQRNRYGKSGNENGKVVIVNLQKTPDDDECDLRIFAKTDLIFEAVMKKLEIPIDPAPIWKPRDAKPIDKIPKRVNPYYIEAATRLAEFTDFRVQEEASKMVNDQKPAKSSPAEYELILGNDHQLIEGEGEYCNKHRWTAYARVKNSSEISDLIDHVDFALHPTFHPAVVTVSSAPFQITRIGWGYFPITATVHWKNGKISKHVHTLSFSENGGETMATVQA